MSDCRRVAYLNVSHRGRGNAEATGAKRVGEQGAQAVCGQRGLSLGEKSALSIGGNPFDGAIKVSVRSK